MTRQLLILHLSDLHFGKNNRFGQMDKDELAKRFRLAIEDAKGDLSTEERICLVIITGDIADAAIPEEYEQADSFLSSLSAELKLDKLRFVFVPGNHDVCWPDCGKVEFDQKKYNFSDDELRKRIDKCKFDSFKDFLQQFYGKELNEVAQVLDNDALVYDFKDIWVSIAALNSCELESHRKDDHNGMISEKQAQTIMDCWKNEKYTDWIKIIAFHHNLKPAKEEVQKEWSEYLEAQQDKGELSAEDVLRHESDLFGLEGRDCIETLSQGCQVQLILHGHQHSSSEDVISRNNQKGYIDILSAGSFGLDAKKLPKEQRNSIRLILLDIDNEQMLTTIRIYDRTAKAPESVSKGWFVKDTSRKEVYVQDLQLPTNYKSNAGCTGADKQQSRSRKGGFSSFTDYAESIRNFIDDYLGRPDQPVPFGGRDGELKAFDAWLDNPASPPYLLLAAPAGRGKSALLVRWKERLESRKDVAVIFVPVSIRRGTNLASVVFTALASQLARLHEDMPPDPNATIASLHGIIQHFLARPLPDGRSLIVIMDGLDEAADWKAGQDLFPSNPIKGLRIVVSARYLADCANADSWLRRIGWDRPGLAFTSKLTKLSKDGIADVLNQMGFPLADLSQDVDITNQLFRLSDYGDPLLVHLYVEDLWARGEKAARLKPEDLKTIKKGYDGYFEKWWELQRKLWDKQCEARRTAAPTSEPLVWEMLNIFACARGPLTRGDILKLMPAKFEASTWKINNTLELLERFIIGDGRDQGYIFGHPKLGQHFKGKLADSERREIESRFIEYGKETLRALNDGMMGPGDAPHYVVRYYSSHLEDQAGNDQLIFDLVSKGWLQSWVAHEGAYSGFLNDVDKAWQAAVKADRKEIMAGRKARYIGNIILYALCFSSVNSLSGNISPWLLFLLVENGIFGLSQGLAYARQKPDLSDRARALSILSRLNDSRKDEILTEALDVARQIKDNRKRSETLAHVVFIIADSRRPELLNDALGIAHQIKDYLIRCIALIEVASKLDDSRRQELLREAIEAARQIKDDRLRSGALADAACLLDASLRPKLLNEAIEAARQIKDNRKRSRALADAACLLDASLRSKLLNEALEAAHQIKNEECRSRARSEVEFLLHDSRYFESFGDFHEVTCQIKDDCKMSSSLAEVAFKLDDSRRQKLLRVALEAARQIKDDWLRSRALADALCLLYDCQRPELLIEALKFARKIKDEECRASALAGIASKFEDSRRPELLNEAIEAARQIKDDWLRSKALAEVASKFEDSGRPELQDDALDVVIEIKDERLRSGALAELTSKFADSGKPQLLNEALKVACQIKDDWPRSIALAELASKFADSGKPQQLNKALKVTDQIKDEECKSRALAEVASKFADSQRLEILNEALEVARQIKDDWLRSKALAELASKFADSQRLEILNETLEITHQIKDDWLRSKALAELASKFADSQRLELLNEAFEAAREIKDSEDRSSALAEVAFKFADFRRPELLNDALDVVSQIKDKWLRSKALTEVASKLSNSRRLELLNNSLEIARQIKDDWQRSNALSRVSLPYSAYQSIDLYDPWCDIVRLCISRRRTGTLSDLQAMMPIIVSLGGQEALKCFADSILIVGQWWP